MKTIDRYILTKSLWPLFTCIAIALIALLLERMVRLLDLVVHKGGPFLLILKMLANLIPHYLGIAIPAAFFIGVLLAIMRLCGDSELDAIHTMGVGLRRLVIPLLGLAVVLMVSSAIIIGFLQPYTRYAYRALVFTVTNTAWNSALERGSFFSGIGNFTITIDDISDAGRNLAGIFLHQTKSDGTTTTTTAEAGKLYRSQTDFKLILRLSKGAWVESDSDGRNSTVLTFDQLDIPLDLALGPTAFRPREGERELTILELLRARQRPPPGLTLSQIDAELNARLVRVVSLLFLPFLAIPLGIASRRARRGAGLVAGLILLIVYHHMLQLGESLADDGVVSPIIGLWVPCAMFAAIGLWTFHAADARPGHIPVSATLDRMVELSEQFWHRIHRGTKAA
ncbi:MAG: LPS export ABC transporter permease LptF [Dongiaceae bacterium]